MSTIIDGRATYTTDHAIGDVVHLKLHPFDDRPSGMVTALHIREGLNTYGVTWADSRQETVHQAIELVPADEDDR